MQSTTTLATYESPASYKLDNMDITDFLFELIKQTKGQEELKNMVLKSSLGEISGSMDINMTVFNIIREVFFCLFDVIIPERLCTEGFSFNLSEVDPTKMLSIDPNTPEGRHIYDSNDPEKSLNCLIYTALQTTGDADAVRYRKNGQDLFTLYYEGGNQMRFKFGINYANQKLSVWAEDYLQGLTFFNIPNFIAELVDIITGIVSIKVGRSSESYQDQAKIQKVLSKLFGFCQSNADTQSQGGITGQILEPISVSPTSYLQDQEDKRQGGGANQGNLFDFSSDDLLNMEDIANLRSQGKVRFATCGNFEMAINPDETFAKMDALFEDRLLNTTVTYIDPTTNESKTAQAYDNTVVVPDLTNTAAFLNNVFADNAITYKSEDVGDEQGTPSASSIVVNMPTMEAEFELSVIKAIPYALTQLIISPQLLMLIKAAAVVSGEGENAGAFTLEGIFDKLYNIISKIGTDIWNGLLNNIFGILVKELTNILSSVATKYLSQQASNYLSVIQFLVNLIKGLNLQAKGCQSMLDIITQLLSLNYFGPQLPVPPPLIYVGGLLKPGMNEVSAVNNLKSTLADKGLEVGATMSDGTPNYNMLVAEETLKAAIKEVRNASGQVYALGATGPVMGYAQLI